MANISIPINGDCGMRRRRSVGWLAGRLSGLTIGCLLNVYFLSFALFIVHTFYRLQFNPKGVILEATIVLMLHRRFLTRNDKAFRIEASARSRHICIRSAIRSLRNAKLLVFC